MTPDRPFSDLVKTMEAVVLGLKEVSLTLFRSLVVIYDVDAVKSYEGHQDPTQD